MLGTGHYDTEIRQILGFNCRKLTDFLYQAELYVSSCHAVSFRLLNHDDWDM